MDLSSLWYSWGNFRLLRPIIWIFQRLQGMVQSPYPHPQGWLKHLSIEPHHGRLNSAEFHSKKKVCLPSNYFHLNIYYSFLVLLKIKLWLCRGNTTLTTILRFIAYVRSQNWPGCQVLSSSLSPYLLQHMAKSLSQIFLAGLLFPI